jgi:rhodanese-related sulfurtransferase
MQQLIEYIGHHTLLAAGAAFAGLMVLAFELQARAQAASALSAMQAVRLMNQGALVIDVRARDQFEVGHIAEARNLLASELDGQADSLAKWRDKTVIAYCADGRASASAARTLTKLGFTKAFSLSGGLNAWLKENLPLAKPVAGGK